MSKKLEEYLEEEKDKIIEEIELFYGKNCSPLNKYINIFKILSIINKKEIYLFDELSKEILYLPLKFLEIKKEEIKIKDLQIFALVSKNQKLLNIFREIEKDENNIKLNKLIEINEESKVITQFMNNEKYCSEFIYLISEKKKEKLLNKKIINKDNNYITVYYLDYLFPYMEEIFSCMLYDLILNTSKHIFYDLLPLSQGGLLEYIINLKKIYL